jgi:hypothetical protein
MFRRLEHSGCILLNTRAVYITRLVRLPKPLPPHFRTACRSKTNTAMHYGIEAEGPHSTLLDVESSLAIG